MRIVGIVWDLSTTERKGRPLAKSNAITRLMNELPMDIDAMSHHHRPYAAKIPPPTQHVVSFDRHRPTFIKYADDSPPSANSVPASNESSTHAVLTICFLYGLPKNAGHLACPSRGARSILQRTTSRLTCCTSSPTLCTSCRPLHAG
jgi:hypothetical protein